MDIQPLVPVADSIPTEIEAWAQSLLHIFRHSQAAARKAAEEYKANELPAEK